MSPFARSFRVTPARLAGLLVAFTLVLVGASQAMATVRYAVPGGNASDPNCFAKSSDCSGQHALDVAQTNDEVIFATGTYDNGSAQLQQNGNPGQDVHGEDGQPPPRIITTSSNFAFIGFGDDDSISHMTFEQHGTGSSLVFFGGSTGHPVLIDTVQAVGASTAIFGIAGNAVISNTSAFANAANGIAVLMYMNETLRGVTAIAPANGGVAVQQNPLSSSTPTTGIVRNTILSGGSGGADLKTTSNGSAHGNVDIDFSNYANVSNCSGCTLTQGPDSQAIPPALADRANGNFHETFDSPTIDSGEDSANNGSFDVDGGPRKVGPAPDIGADEFVPGQGPPGINTTAPPPSTASVLPPNQALGQAFPGLRLGAVTFKVSGNKSFTVPIACPSFVTGNCVGTIVFTTASKVVVPKQATAAAKKKKLKIGKASFSIPHGAKKNVKIKLSKAAQKVLAATGKLKAVDTLTVTANGVKKTSKQNVTLKGKKKH
ncbi:MAG: hypothetical protein ACJ77M_05175 [Thermoleophilaceae bacterium]